MIAIIDYGVGNLFSLKSSFAMLGEQAAVTADENEIEKPKNKQRHAQSKEICIHHNIVLIYGCVF